MTFLVTPKTGQRLVRHFFVSEQHQTCPLSSGNADSMLADCHHVPSFAGQELAFNKEKGLPLPGGTLDPALLSRLLLCHYASLVRSLDKCDRDSSAPIQDAAQALQLHATLRSAHLLRLSLLTASSGRSICIQTWHFLYTYSSKASQMRHFGTQFHRTY